MLRGKDGRNRLPLVGKLHLSACYRAPVCESAEKTVWMLNSPHFQGIFLWWNIIAIPTGEFHRLILIVLLMIAAGCESPDERLVELSHESCERQRHRR